MQGPPPRLLDWLLERESATLRPASVDWATVGTPALRARAMPHQIQAVNRVVDACEGRAILAMPTGTGKSLVSAAAAAHYGGRVLVVASAQQQWRHEFETWTDMRCVLVNGASGDIGARGVDVVISTYKSVGLRSDIMATEWTTVIVDESHKLGGDCDTNAAVVRLCARARCALMVSATPMKGRPRELFNPLSALVPRVFDNRKFFEKRYCDAKMGKFGYEANGSTFTDELRLVVLHSLRVTCGDKTEVLPDLPPISFQDVRLPMPAEVRREFEDMQREYKELTKRAEEAPPHLREQAKLRRDALSMKMFKRTGEVKAPHAVRWLLEELLAKLQPDPTHKVLVFCHHQSVVQETCDALKRAGVPHVSVHGGTPLKKRHEALEAMRDPLDASARVAVLTLGTSAESLNLTGATEVVMFQLSFTPAQNDQAFARAWRKGATRPVTVYRMLADDTSDETILRIHRTKNAHNERLFGPGDDGPPQKTARMTS